MKNTFINTTLQKEVNTIINNGWTPQKGTVGGFSIEIVEKPSGSNNESYSSYIYYKDEKSRDGDFDLLVSMLN